MSESPICPLCLSVQIVQFQSDAYFRCSDCELIFKDPSQHLSLELQKARYLLHQNSIDDLAYVEFLKPVIDEVSSIFQPGARGLDYGSGPTPVLVEILKKKNFEVEAYDPIFSPIVINGEAVYDFVSCTEVAEHFTEAALEFSKIFKILKGNGRLILMTEIFEEGRLLKDWYYARDETHVCFYSKNTMKWIANKYQRRLRQIARNVFCFS
jgi:hypothetical protein